MTNVDDGADGPAALAALERFVVDNDELLELEERIGRFNIFDALRIVDREVKHSDFLAWLLDPSESHGQGGLLLRSILMDLFKTARENGFPCPASPIELDGEDLRGVEVRREWKNIDLLVRCRQPEFVIAIENKIKSGEHSDQLSRYRQTVEGEFGTTPSMYVFLTVEGDEPSEEDWVPYSYGDVHRVLSRVRNANESSIGEDVLAFLDHYLRLLRGRLMDDPKIDELCQTIYKNHRQAIELIVKRAVRRVADLRPIAEAVEKHGGWILGDVRASEFGLWPESWKGEGMPLREYQKGQFCPWVTCFLWRDKGQNKLFFAVGVGESIGAADLRRHIILGIRERASEVRLKPGGRRINGTWVRVLQKEHISELVLNEEPVDQETLIDRTLKRLSVMKPALDRLPAIVRELHDRVEA